MTDEDTDMILARKGNFKYEDFHVSLEEAEAGAQIRSTKTLRAVFMYQTENGFVVCVHGVAKIGWKYVGRFESGVKMTA